MWNWFRSKPTCPVQRESKAWIESRIAWLIREFGWDRICCAPVVLPNDDCFPDAYDGSSEAARAMLDRICGYMEVDPSRVMLDFYAGRGEIGFGTRLVGSEPDAAGLYDESGGRVTVWLEVANLADPVLTAATLVHEVGHAILLGEKRISPDAPDHEPLTDLLSVFLGLGILASNAAVRSHNSHVGNWEAWSVSRLGYLDMTTYGYALALFAWLRDEDNPRWAKWLRPDVRAPFHQGLGYLQETADSTVTRDGPFPPDGSLKCAVSPGPFAPRRAERADEDPAEDADAEGGEPVTADDYFSCGVLHERAGEDELAAADFTEAIRLHPHEAEFFRYRALAYLRLGDPAAALADAEETVRLAPDDGESRTVRASAYLAAGRFHEAIADCDWVVRSERWSADRRWSGEAYLRRGEALAAMGEWKAAADDLTRSINFAPTWTNTYLLRADAYEQLGRTRQALADREKARELGLK